MYSEVSNSGIPIVKKITDLYSIKASGFYYYDAGTTNAPLSSRGGMIIANYLSDSWISLNVVPYASSKIYTNTKYNNTWVGWTESSTKDDYACGVATIKADSGTVDISFPREFSDIPIVVTTVQGLSKDVLLASKVYNINKAKFTVTVVLLNNGAVVSPPYDVTIDWIAMKKS